MKRMMLQPETVNQKSFYNKAIVEYNGACEISLISYNTKMITIKDDKIIYKNDDESNILIQH